MNDDLLLLIIGAGVGFLSTIAVEFIRRFLDIRRREYEETHLREMNLRNPIKTDGSMKSAPLAWLKLVETTTAPRFMRESDTTNSIGPIIRLFSHNKKSTREDGNYRVIVKIILGKTQLIGRQEDCEISLDDVAVSRLHAMIRYDGEDYVIYDMGSTSGTLVNNTRVPDTGRVLVNDDKVTVGRSSFFFERTINYRNDKPRKRERTDTTLVSDNLRRKNKKQ